MVSQKKKKLAFYSILSSGHLNVCASLGVVLLNHFGDKIEIYFICEESWKAHLEKIDSRFKFGVFQYDEKENRGLVEVVDKMESTLSMERWVDKAKHVWAEFFKDPTLLEVDAKSEAEIKKIKPDLLLCDQIWPLPAMVNGGCPYAFIVSANPTVLQLDGIPKIMSDAGANEPQKIKQFDDEMAAFWSSICEYMYEFYEKRNSKYEGRGPINRIRSDAFSIVSFPAELDYFGDEIKQKYGLWHIDTPLSADRMPAPYKLPTSFAALPGKIVYVSLGSLFSAYVHKLQKIVDALEKLPDYKYIVSKGPNGDALVFPSNRFIGENYIQQLAVLQLLATEGGCMIAHGGNNSLGECFYYGVPCVILPILGDQINNATRIQETGYGYWLDLVNFSEEELAQKLDKLLHDQELRRKWTEASKRIQKENRLLKVAERVVQYVERL